VGVERNSDFEDGWSVADPLRTSVLASKRCSFQDVLYLDTPAVGGSS